MTMEFGVGAARREAVLFPFKARPFYDYKTCPLRPGTSGDARGYIVWRGDAWKLCGGGKGLPRLRSGFRRAAQTPHKRLNFAFAGRFVPNRPATLRMTVGSGWGHLECVGVGDRQRFRERQKHADKSVRATRAKQIFGELAPGS